MLQLQEFDFTQEELRDKLFVEDYDDKVINYESFLLVDPITETKFPEFDAPFFDRMNATLRHILFCYKEGWITSERQIFYTSNECLTTIQFVFRGDRVQLSVFQRSSNIKNLKEDVEFLNYFLHRHFPEDKKELNIFVSMPHEFTSKNTKVDKED